MACYLYIRHGHISQLLYRESKHQGCYYIFQFISSEQLIYNPCQWNSILFSKKKEISPTAPNKPLLTIAKNNKVIKAFLVTKEYTELLFLLRIISMCYSIISKSSPKISWSDFFIILGARFFLVVQSKFDLCRSRDEGLEKPRPHFSHVYGFSPVCMFMWNFSS